MELYKRCCRAAVCLLAVVLIGATTVPIADRPIEPGFVYDEYTVIRPIIIDLISVENHSIIIFRNGVIVSRGTSNGDTYTYFPSTEDSKSIISAHIDGIHFIPGIYIL
jgi:hypothetical protein